MSPTIPSTRSEDLASLDPRRWKGKTLIFGGTFDPPHAGHREAVLDLALRLQPRRILILPAGDPPLKSTLTESRHRLAMARLCFAYAPAETGGCPVEVDPRETLKHGRSYTFDTLTELRRELPGLVFVFGTDQLFQMERWHRFPELLELSDWIVLLRRPEREERALAELRRWVDRGWLRPEGSHWLVAGQRDAEPRTLHLLSTPAREISSTEIRSDLQTGLRHGTLTPEVAQYIVTNGLYGSGSTPPEP